MSKEVPFQPPYTPEEQEALQARLTWGPGDLRFLEPGEPDPNENEEGEEPEEDAAPPLVPDMSAWDARRPK